MSPFIPSPLFRSLLAASALAALSPASVGQDIQIVSIGSAGEASTAASRYPRLSSNDRYLSFSDESAAWSMLDGTEADIWRYDRLTGETVLVSLSETGAGLDEDSSFSLPLDDGSVLFQSRATNVVSGDSTEDSDLFVRDLAAGSTGSVSVDNAGDHQTSSSIFGTEASFSASDDGRYVVWSTFEQLVPADTLDDSDVYLRDRVAGTTTLITTTTSGGGSGTRPFISGDGEWISFSSIDASFVTGDTNDAVDAFLYERATGDFTRLSVDTQGQQLEHGGMAGSLSYFGDYVLHFATSTELTNPPVVVTAAGACTSGCSVGGDEGIGPPPYEANLLYRYDRDTGENVLVSQGTGGRVTPYWSGSGSPRMSVFGNRVVMTTSKVNWWNAADDNLAHTYVRNIGAGTTTLIDRTAPGVAGLGPSSRPDITSKGSSVVFSSYADDLVSGDTNSTADIFISPASLSSPWKHLGASLGGDTNPVLHTRGFLAEGETVTVQLKDGLDSGTSFLVLGLNALNAPFRQGVFVPSIDLIKSLNTDSDAEWSLSVVWPAGIPVGTEIYLQAFVPDSGAPAGFALSNAVRGITQDP
ncbi:MAG: hypothetical protein DHS20C15_04330 [Planctomycetota bacterium]|nr:MAG: hypothetical protein DHS20C15_04330 [Planctomycetota bacterium]